ncbi:LacI family DNA-binding transcriptional regulator [Reinekea thalattae]|uniref:LacI family DNA-binding transcriptional regulator n=1 Tax=Reinekea thalattae TaxID=2593301 RepID=A0A5C8Z9L9_9GAMM|nr:LacI family DNA-binding transcriptional regulator [Reinekea thalattae]TXR53918.1 LacI family DNA-binding transcriptional regulator [Reinekea thalattae]
MNNKKTKTVVTAQDVADLAGVSRSAVSRTFTENGSISEQTKAKVLRAAEQLGYQVNFLAQGLNRRRSQLIGVVVAHLSDPFRSSLLEALLSEIKSRGYQALVTEVRKDDDLEDTLRRFTQYRVSGVVVTSGQPPEALVEECLQLSIPVVGINRAINLSKVDVVCSDNQKGAQLAAQQLMSAGCQTIGWLNYKDSTWSGVDRGEHFKAALHDWNQQPAHQLINIKTEQNCYEGARAAAHQLVASGQQVDGVFCATALMACGFLDGMREQGKHAPEDFHLIGFDNTPLTSQYSYQLTTIDHSVKETAEKVLWCLESRANNPELAQRQEQVAVSLLTRHTSP